MTAPQDPYQYDYKPQVNQDDYLLNDFMTDASDNGCSYTRMMNPESPMTEE